MSPEQTGPIERYDFVEDEVTSAENTRKGVSPEKIQERFTADLQNAVNDYFKDPAKIEEFKEGLKFDEVGDFGENPYTLKALSFRKEDFENLNLRNIILQGVMGVFKDPALKLSANEMGEFTELLFNGATSYTPKVRERRSNEKTHYFYRFDFDKAEMTDVKGERGQGAEQMTLEVVVEHNIFLTFDTFITGCFKDFQKKYPEAKDQAKHTDELIADLKYPLLTREALQHLSLRKGSLNGNNYEKVLKGLYNGLEKLFSQKKTQLSAMGLTFDRSVHKIFRDYLRVLEFVNDTRQEMNTTLMARYGVNPPHTNDVVKKVVQILDDIRDFNDIEEEGDEDSAK